MDSDRRRVALRCHSLVNRKLVMKHSAAGTNATQSSVVHAKLELSEAQTKAAKSFIIAAAAVSESLAADDLGGFNRAAPQVAPALDAFRQTLPVEHPWRPLLQKIADSGRLVPAGDLAEARKGFLPFSTTVTGFVRTAREQADALKSLKLYRCPMAPQPGLWLQLQGPLRNPYFGSEMLDCGTEVTP